MPKFIDRTGKRFGRLTVVGVVQPYCKTNKWQCICDCGKVKEIHVSNFCNTKSCGCLCAENLSKMRKTHGMAKTRIYHIWCNMRRRCNDVKNQAYDRYGGRGITVCERWMKFENFLKDMGERPEGMSLDRIDNNSGYSPDNCRWATTVEQNNNQRKNVFITLEGKTQTLAQWCREKGMLYRLVRKRLHLGWSPERAFGKS